MRTASLVYAFQGSAIESFTKGDKFFIKFFLLDASLNKNNWRVTWEAIKEHHADFIGKPFIILPNHSHPYPRDPEKIFQAQKPYEKGSIVETGLDESQKKAWAIAEITDAHAREQIQNGEIKFVSPSMLSYNHEIRFIGEEKIILGFEAAHVAGVGNPAYGVLSAQIKGTCSCEAGKCDSCMNTLKMVQADVSVETISDDVLTERIDDTKERIVIVFKLLMALKQILLEEPDNVVIQEEVAQKKQQLEWMVIDLLRLEKAKVGELQASIKSINADSECVSQCLQNKADNGIEIDDQAIAICYSECYQDSSSGELASYNSNILNPSKKKIEMSGNEDLAKTLKQLQADLEKTKSDLKETVTKYEADIKAVQTENSELKLKIDAEQKKPVIAKIIDAKTKLNIKAEKEEEALLKMPLGELQTIESQYSTLSKAAVDEEGQVRYPPMGFSADVGDEVTKLSNSILVRINGKNMNGAKKV